MGVARSSRGWAAILTAVGALAVLPACAAPAGLGPEAPRDPAEPFEPSSQAAPLDTIDDARTALDRAARELELAMAELPAGGGRSYASPPTDDPSAVPDAPPAELEVQRDPRPSGPGATGRPCVVACRALASMRRAANRLCALTDASDSRCVRAERRLARGIQRVRQACPRCRS